MECELKIGCRLNVVFVFVHLTFISNIGCCYSTQPSNSQFTAIYQVGVLLLICRPLARLPIIFVLIHFRLASSPHFIAKQYEHVIEMLIKIVRTQRIVYMHVLHKPHPTILQYFVLILTVELSSVVVLAPANNVLMNYR